MAHSAKLSIFIKLPFVIKIFVLSIFEWLFYTGFTIPIIQDLWYLPSHVVGSIATQGTSCEGKSSSIRTFHLADAAISIQGSRETMVTKPHCIFHPFLHNKKKTTIFCLVCGLMSQ